MAEQPVGVAILGLGNIGSAVARAIAHEADALEQTSGVRLRLVGVLDRGAERADRAEIDPALVTTDAAALVDDPSVRVVVEVLGREQPAAELMRRALASGKHVVTANKEAVSKHLPDILAAARDGDAAFLCEASVGGGIPLFAALRQIRATNHIERLRGIVNGTTNFILSKMDAEGADYAATLAEAQQLGYAEPDPTADVEGFDAAYKLAILASLALGRHVRPEEIERTGISGVTAADIANAKARGGTIKLIASLERVGDAATLRVAPTVVAGDDLFSRVTRNFNAIEIVGDRVGPVLLHGQGAGPGPTSSAILSDVIEAVRSGSAAGLSTLD
jgi:homoserine dehydrogenase